MSILKKESGIVSSEKIIINEIELHNRLGKCNLEEIEDKITQCFDELINVAKYKYCYALFEISIENETIDFGQFKICSRNLSKNLLGCKKAFVFAATLGADVDRTLNKASVVSFSKQFIMDACASTMIESFCDYINNEFKKDYLCKPRFSPGFGDLPLEIQPEIIKTLDTPRVIGLNLTNDNLMTPTKSVTAIVGVTND